MRDEVEAAAEQLGDAIDLMMVRELVSTHAQGVTADALTHLTETLDAAIDAALPAARQAARDPFRAPAKKLTRRVDKALRRDLAPPDDDSPADAD